MSGYAARRATVSEPRARLPSCPAGGARGFGVSSAFATTVATSRMINCVRERRRRLPWVRSIARRVYHSPGASRVRVHHFTPGVVMILAAGGGSIFAPSDGREEWFSLPFGVGAGLTLDELGLLLELDSPYWGGEKFAFAQITAAASTAAALLVRFHLAGKAMRLDGLPQDAAVSGDR